jgi:hypothetical protein
MVDSGQVVVAEVICEEAQILDGAARDSLQTRARVYVGDVDQTVVAAEIDPVGDYLAASLSFEAE